MGGMPHGTTFKMSGNMGNIDPQEIFKMFFSNSGNMGGFTRMSSNMKGGAPNMGSGQQFSGMDEEFGDFGFGGLGGFGGFNGFNGFGNFGSQKQNSQKPRK